MNILRLSTGLQAELIKALNSGADTRRMMSCIADRVASDDVLGVDACSICLLCPDRTVATQYAGTGYQRKYVGKAKFRIVPTDKVVELPSKQQRIGITSWILSVGKPFLAQSAEQLQQHPHYTGKHDPERLPGEGLGLCSLLGVPIRAAEGVSGLIKVERRERDKPLTVDDEVLLKAVARVIGKCKTYAEMAEKGLREEAVAAWTIDVISEAAASESELDSFLHTVVTVTAHAMGADSCGIYLIDESKRTLTQRAGVGSQQPRCVIRSYRLPSSDQTERAEERVGLTAWIAATGETFYARDFEELKKHPHHRGEYDRWNFPAQEKTQCGAFMGTPLRTGTTVIGLLKVENVSRVGVPDSRGFSEKKKTQFDVLAHEIALAIHWMEEPGQGHYQLVWKAQPTISEILSGSLNTRSLVEKVVTETAKLFNARACALFLKEGDKLVQPPWAAYGWAKRGPRVREYRLVDPKQIRDNPTKDEKVGLTVWIAVKRERFTARSNLELRMHPHHKGTYDKFNFEPGQQCESFMGVPLVVRGELVGVLKVETKMKPGLTQEVTYFTEQDELVFDLIANSAANAIHYIQYAKLQKRHEAEAIALIYKLTLLAFAHRGRGELSLTKHILEQADATIANLPNPEAKFSIKERERIYNIIRDTEYSIEVLNDLYSQYERWFGAGDQRVPVQIGDIVVSALEELKKDRRRKLKGVPVKLNIPEGLPCVWGRPSVIRYVIHELLRNARKYAKSKIALFAESTTQDKVTIFVADDGRGIQPELRKAFEKGMVMRKQEVTEGGLGLLLSKHFMDGEHGQLEVVSPPARMDLGGACFAMTLPTKDIELVEELED